MAESRPSAQFDIRKADAAYKSFPTFAEWTAKTSLSTVRWDRYTARLNELKKSANGEIGRVREAIEVATAIDTGALEGLYETDRGFTFTVAFESAVWQAVVEEKKGDKVRALIEAQLGAFEYVLDFATKRVPISVVWIRELHNQICKEQETYKALTELGLQDIALPKGQYKTLPNHVINRDDLIHSYAPVDCTPTEMRRLCDEVNTDNFQNAHPVLQASYIHYAFVLIHPFADGNGRVARALASIFTYRSHSIPLLIFSDNRNEYISSLEQADRGNFQAFIDFILNTALGSIKLFSESLESSAAGDITSKVSEIESLYTTKGGYSQKEVDGAAFRLLDEFERELREQIGHGYGDNIRTTELRSFNHSNPNSAKYRFPASRGKDNLTFSFSTLPPLTITVQCPFLVEVPKNYEHGDDIILRDIVNNSIFEAQANDLIPKTSSALQMRIRIFVTLTIKKALAELAEKAKEQS